MNHPISTNVVNPGAGGESHSHANEALTLRTQIMANANLLFWSSRPSGATTLTSEIGIMATKTCQEKCSRPGYMAILTIPIGLGRNWSTAAEGDSRETIVAALQSLLDVTATALFRYSLESLKSMSAPKDISGGRVDEGLFKGGKDKSWGGFLG